jgi:hypothetical protein
MCLGLLFACAALVLRRSLCIHLCIVQECRFHALIERVCCLPACLPAWPARWDEPKFPLRRPVKETLEKVTEIMGHLEDDLKVRHHGACRACCTCTCTVLSQV